MYASENPGDYRNYVSAAQAPAQVASLASAAAAPEKAFSLWDSDGFSFGDIVDIVNPLQHIPVVSAIYRELTGDDIGPGPRVLGGALFGGAIGAVVSLVNVLIENSTGKDVGEHAIAMMFGDDNPFSTGDPNVMIARAPVSGEGSTTSEYRAPEWDDPDRVPAYGPAGYQATLASAGGPVPGAKLWQQAKAGEFESGAPRAAFAEAPVVADAMRQAAQKYARAAIDREYYPDPGVDMRL